MNDATTVNITKPTPSTGDAKENMKKKLFYYASDFVIDKISTYIDNKNKPSTSNSNNNLNSMDKQQLQQSQQSQQQQQQKQQQNQQENHQQSHQSSQLNKNNKYGYIEEDDKLLEVLITSPQDFDNSNIVEKNQKTNDQQHSTETLTNNNSQNELKSDKKKSNKKKEKFYQTKPSSSGDDNDDYLTADELFGDSDDNENNSDDSDNDNRITNKNNSNIKNNDEKIINNKNEQSGKAESESSTINNNNKSIGKETNTLLSTQDGKDDKNLLLNNTTSNIGASTGHALSTSSTSDYSGYIQKKSLAQGMMDLALLSANTNQLRYILEYKDQHPYFGTSFSLVIASLFLQIAVGLALLWNTKFNVKKQNEMKEADRVNNFGVVCIFLVTLINVFLSTFGGAPNAKSPPGVETATIDTKSIASTIADTVTTIFFTSTTTEPPTTPTTTIVHFNNDESVLYN